MRVGGIIVFILLWFLGYAQQGDSITRKPIDSVLVAAHIDFLYQQMTDEAEALAEESIENGMDDDVGEVLADRFEELLEEYERCRDSPVNINGKEAERLVFMGLLTPFQLEGIQRYRRQYGDLLLPEELMMIEELDPRTVAVISPIVFFGKSDWEKAQEEVTLRKAVTRGKHQLTLNYGLKPQNDEYLGDPTKLQLKYIYHYGNRLRFGVAMEKDAGEPLYYDFYGAHLYMTDLKIIKGSAPETDGDLLVVKDLALGDYQLSFGQGLTLWSGMSFGKASGGSSVMRRGRGIQPKASTSEGVFFRGAAATMACHDFQATAFYSLRRIDATISETEPIVATALQESGYHRTLEELEKRHRLRQQVFGGRIAYVGPQLEVGGTAYQLRLGAPLQLKPSKYNQFYFQGDRLSVAGFDFRWQRPKAVFFGELSMSGNKAFAGLVGTTVKPIGYIDFTMLYRNYGKQYQNLFFGAIKESSRGQAEEGYYLGIQCTPFPRWNLLATCDFFRLKWLSSQVYSPSWGQEYSLKLLHQINSNASMQLRFKSKTKMKNSTDDHVFSYYPVFYTKRSLQFQLSYTLFDSWVLCHKAAYTHYFNDDGADSRGYLICQDIAYKPPEKPYSLTFRYALFDSDDYYSRISLYENDVLGAFSTPSLFGHGSRVYLLGKLKLFKALSVYARIGCTFLNEEIKTDIKAEVIISFDRFQSDHQHPVRGDG